MASTATLLLARRAGRARRVLASSSRLSSLSPVAAGARAASTFANVPLGPPDPIFGLTDAFNKDTFPKKVSLGVGAYRDDKGKPHVLESVRQAEKKVLEAKMNHEYAGIQGVGEYVQLALEFAYGADSAALKEKRIAGVQTISGTGACRLAGDFYARFMGKGSPLYLPDPTWGNHIPIYKDAGLEVKRYRYFDPKTNGLDFKGVLEDVTSAPTGSIFLLHACAHNPTGVDPSEEQWKELSALFKKKGHAILFDAAYLGFASGNADKDAFALRQFAADGHSFLMAQSFAKNFGLYGERVGTLSAVCASAEEAKRVDSQLKILIRPLYSNPPIYGARLVATILRGKFIVWSFGGRGGREGVCVCVLNFVCKFVVCACVLVPMRKARPFIESLMHISNRIFLTIHHPLILSLPHPDPELRPLFYKECKAMADRIIEMRALLRDTLEKLGSKLPWQHVTDQIGMFCFTGLRPAEVAELKEKYHIYITNDGRISIAGLNSANVQYVAESFHAVTSKR